ncbi:MAG TPA: hypothetical protein VI298_09235 [Geobacteraceae bacterium]
MRVIRNLPLVALLLCSFSLPAPAAEIPPAPGWDAVLDGIYAHTWRGRTDLDAELRKDEARIGQDLAGYLAGWERRMAVPIVYTGGKRKGDGCDPLAYCAADLSDPGGLILKLREKKEPLARFLFDRLSPEAQKTVATHDPAGASADAARQLAGELTRIVREDPIYDKDRFAGVRLSYAAATLVNEHNDADNRVCVNKTLLADAFPAELAHNFKCVILKDETYRRVVAAKTVQYLRTGDKKSLDQGIALSEKFEDKLTYTDFAFWYYYPRALADVQAGDAAALKYDAYGVLNNAILGLEGPEPAGGEEAKRRLYGWNLADAVLVRGIMAGRLEGLEALGSAVWLLGDLGTAPPADPREQELTRLLVDLRKYLAGPASDNYRLNYAVAMREGESRRALLARTLDAGEGGAQVERLFREARDYLLLACAWAETGQGRATAAANYLDLVNLALARMKDILPPAAYAELAANPGKVNAGTAAQLYRELADRENDGWERLRFIDRKGYVDGMQRLWNALRRNALLTGDYYLARMDRDDFQSVMDNAEPAERALLRYAQLFEGFTANGYREIVPDSAYFAYADDLKMLARLKRAVSAYNNSIELHNQSVDYLIRAIEVYPYDGSIDEYAAISRSINANPDAISPADLMARTLANDLTAKCLHDTGSYCDRNAREVLAWNVYKVKNGLSDKRGGARPDELLALVKNWRDSLPATADSGKKPGRERKAGRDRSAAKPKATAETERAGILRLAERYLALAGQLEAASGDAAKRLDACRAGDACAGAREAIIDLLARKDVVERVGKELADQCATYRQTLGSGKEQQVLAGLAGLVTDVSFHLAERVIALDSRQESRELRHNDNHPMHKVIKSAFYAGR